MALPGASACEYANGTQRRNKRTVSACLRRVVGRNVIARLLSPDRHCDQLNRTWNSPESMILLPAAGQAESASRRRQAQSRRAEGAGPHLRSDARIQAL